MSTWMDFFIIEDKCIWYSDGEMNALYRYSRDNKNLEIVNSFPSNEIKSFRLYAAAVDLGDRIVFSPYHAENIAIYDKKKNEFETINLPSRIVRHIPFDIIQKYNRYICMIASGVDSLILRLDIDTKEIVIHKYKKYDTDAEYSYLCRDSVIVGDSVFIGMRNHAIIVEYVITQGKVIYHKISGSEGIGTLAYHNGFFWVSRESTIEKIDLVNGTMLKYDQFPNGFAMQYINRDGKLMKSDKFDKEVSTWGKPFFKSRIINKQLYILSANMNMSLRIELFTGDMKALILCENETLESINRLQRPTSLEYLAVESFEDKYLYFYSARDTQIYEYDCINDILQPLESIKKEVHWEKVLEKNQILPERVQEITLDTFIRNLDYTDKKILYGGEVGRKIYAYIKQINL